MMGLASSAPQALQGMTQPLSQIAQVPQQIGGQLSGMLGSMPGLGGGPGAGGLAAGAPGSSLAASVGGVNGGFGSGGGAVSAALTKPAGRYGWPGRVALGVVGARLGRRRPQRIGAKQARCGRTRRDACHGCSRYPDGFGNVWHAAGRAPAGQRRDQGASRGEDDTSLSVVLEDADAIPILTADGVVYRDGGG